MVQRYIHVLFRIAAVLMLGVCMSCQIGEMFEPVMPDYPKDVEYMTLAMQSSKLLPHQVATRASDPKTEAEKAINHMHILYFNSDTGELLEPYTDPKTEKARFFPYVETDLTVIKIDKHAMLEANVRTDTNNNPELPESLKVYVCVLANMENIIDGVNSDGMPLIGGEVVTMDIMQAKAYEHPSKASGGAALLSLPKTGMPMVGQEAIELKKDMDINNLTVELHALMARVDFSIKIDAPVYEENFPKLTMQNWSVHNLPTQVSLNNSSNAVTTLAATEYTEASMINNQIIINKKGTVSFSFYMFENIQGSLNDITNGTTVLKDGNIVPNEWVNTIKTKYANINWDDELQHMTISDIQKFKPLLANDYATYVTISSTYTTPDDKSYDITYTLYLGANHTYDYNIKRNYQYKNDITIAGITQHDGNGNNDIIGKYTYDARAEIKESSGYFVSLLNEREHDAHFCVTPMDVYLFNGGHLKVSLDKTSLDANGNPWVRMEHIPSSNMADGSAVNDNCIEIGESFTAGNSIRKHFTADLVTETLKKNTEFSCGDRDRIYFYIDENLSTTVTREATVTLNYTDENGHKSTSTLTLTQVPLLEVKITYTKDGGWFGEDEEITYYIYMEQFEEYLDHYDPLNEYSTERIYEGLQWGMKGETIGNIGDTKIQENYHDGIKVTNYIVRLDATKSSVTERKDNELYILDTPSTAAGYCYSKNKWEKDGTSAIEKWFLPGITQMEKTLELFYNQYEEFQSNFYWSSSSGKKRTGNFIYSYPEDNNYGRAVIINKNGMQAASDWGDTNDTADINKIITTDNGQRVAGKIPRDKHLRVRAFRTDLN